MNTRTKNFEREISKYGLTVEQYEKCLQTIRERQSGVNDLDYSEIKDMYGIQAHYDTIRKASQTIFGGAFVSEYLENKRLNNHSISGIKDIIGEQLLLKKQLQKEKREINKFKNDLFRVVAVSDDIKNYFKENPVIFYPECNKKIPFTAHDNNDSSMIVCISDWHIGLIINDCKGNYYNYEIAKERVNHFIYEIVKYIKWYNIQEVMVINLGDTIENTYMRRNQSQNCEFGQGEQISKAIILIFNLLRAISETGVTVYYDGVAGNHDRFTSDKSENLDGDNVNSVITPLLSALVKESGIQNIKVQEKEIYGDDSIDWSVQGLNCKFVHGHKSTTKDIYKIKNQSSMDNVFYDLYFEGHWHNYKCQSENNGRYIITTGCLSGYNDYSIQFGCNTVASQTITVIKDGRIEIIKDVQLG